MSLLASRVSLGPLRWAGLPPAWMLVLLVLAAVLWMRTIYRRERGNAKGWQRWILVGLRTLVLLAIGLVLSGPYREETHSQVEASHLVVLVDTSASMQTEDQYPTADERTLLAGGWSVGDRPKSLDGVSRADLVQQYLAPEGQALLEEWGKRFVLHLYAFDADWRSLGMPASGRGAGRGADAEPPTAAETAQVLGDALRAHPFDGGRTRLGALLRNVANEFGRRADRQLAGVVLISDGRDTSDGEPPLATLAAMGPVKTALRVTPVLVGNPSSGKNLWLERIRAKDVVLVQDEVLFETNVRHRLLDGLEGVEVAMEITQVADAKGNPIDVPYAVRGDRARGDQRLGPLPDGSVPEPVRLRATFDRAGTFQIRIKAEMPPGHEADDAVRGDNVQVHKLRVMDTRIKVLYVEGEPRHDWRFLTDYLTREPPQRAGDPRSRNRFEVNVLLQSADPKFRQPSSPGVKPLREFPQTRRELFEYDVLVLGDIYWRRLSASRDDRDSRRIAGLIVEFVEQGGGIALQAGATLQNPIELLETPLGRLFPVSIDKTADERATTRGDMSRPFRIQLTEAGRQSPIFSIVPGASDAEPIPSPELVAKTWRGGTDISERWQWYWLYKATGGLRPGAVDLARVHAARGQRAMTDDRGQPFVVFAQMPFGKGRVFWSALDTISQIRRGHRNEFYGAFWEQVIRGLATYRLLVGARRIKIFTDKESYFVGDTATVTVLAFDQEYEPLMVEHLDGVHIESPNGRTEALEGDTRPRSLASEGQPGTYRFHVPVRADGAYRIWIEEQAYSGRGARRRERAEHRFDAQYRAAENVLSMPDLELLQGIRAATHPPGHEGEVLRLPGLGSFVRQMPTRERERILQRTEKTLWDRWWVLVAITALLAAEWALRKRWQMI